MKVKTRDSQKVPLLSCESENSVDSGLLPRPDLESNYAAMASVNEPSEVLLESNEEIFDCCSKYENANWLQRTLFSWVYVIIKKGRLSLDMLGNIPTDDSAKVQKDMLYKSWSKRRGGGKNAMFRAILACYKWCLVKIFALNLIAAMLDASMPFILKEIMWYIEEEDTDQEDLNRALIFVGLMLAVIFFSRIFKENLLFYQLKIGVQAKQGISSMIYSKVLRISPATNKAYKKGDMVSLTQVDANKVMFIFDTLPDISRIPFLLCFLLLALYMFIGWTFLAALGLIVIFGFINFFIAKLSASVQKERMKRLDKRIHKVSEVIDNINLIKFNSWIDKYIEIVNKARRKEIVMNVKKQLLWVANMTFMNLNYPLLTISIFMIAILGAKMTIAVPTALAILQLLNALNASSKSLPVFIGDFTEFLVSMERVQKFLVCDEIEKVLKTQPIELNDLAIDISDSHFFWGFEKRAHKKHALPPPAAADILDLDPEASEINLQKTTKEKKKTKINESDDEGDNSSEASSPDDYSEEDSEDTENSDEDDDKMTLYDKITLKSINLEIKHGEFVAVIGGIGSGKTSLLSSMIGDMLHIDKYTVGRFKDFQIFKPKHDDDEENRDRLLALNNYVYEKFNEARKHSICEPACTVRGDMSLIEQTPWILNQTIRNNILFGETLDPDRYNRTIELCQLARDLDILPGGDLTQIGEKGVNLSGGQKARISIARAVYANKDIVLMDDPLSALDAHVKKEIFEQVCCGELRDKTRILVTHAVDFLDKVDKIVVMDKGKILYQGHFNELKELDYFKTIVDHMRQETIEEEEEIKKSEKGSEPDEDDYDELEVEPIKPMLVKRNRSYLSQKGTTINADENKEKIRVDWRVFLKYFAYSKWTSLYMILNFLALAMNRVALMLFSYYMLNWVKDISESHENNMALFQKVLYATVAITVIAWLSGLIQIGFILSISVNLFKRMLNRVCHAPVNIYFDVTPSGVILNRFSKDIQVAENNLPNNVRNQIINHISIISGLALAAYNVVWVLIAVPFIVLACYKLLKMFKSSLKETSRIESISSSPIITHLSESISGASTIRTYGKVEEFLSKQYFLQDQNAIALLVRRAVKGWFSTRVAFIIVAFTAFTFGYCMFAKGSMDSVMIGLMMVYMLEIQENIIRMLRQMAMVEAKMVSFERCLNITKIPQEAAMRLPVPKDVHGDAWVSHGNIKFVGYSAKYRPDAEIVLDNVDIEIRPGEKIGVVGRTGAGKSTLCLAICRFLEAHSGRIEIDGVDISKVGLADLRDNITVIPQDPAIFENKLRLNLDPDETATDEEIVQLLNKANLTDLLARDSKGLDAKIKAGDLSSGEKQLICICRAILRKKKIVIMDEATANIDVHTEKIIQKLIDVEFKDCTVITVAHRLNTVIRSSKICVMSYGKVIEFDKPSKLMKDPNSSFYSLLKEFNN